MFLPSLRTGTKSGGYWSERDELSPKLQAELFDLVQNLTKKVGAGEQTASVEREADRYLQMLGDSVRGLVRQDCDDVFVPYLMEKLESLAHIFSDAATKSRLQVSEHQFSSAQHILSAFGAGEKVYRYTWLLNLGERLFDEPSWQKHFQLTASMAHSGSMEVYTIFIGENRQYIEGTNVQRLLEFFATQRRMHAKFILRAEWESLMVNHAIPSTCIDFGIYGRNLLYEADGYKPVSVGTWSKDQVEINRYIEFFDVAWQAAKDAQLGPAREVTLAEALAADQAKDRRSPVHEAIARLDEKVA